MRSYIATGDEPTANLTLRLRQSLDLRLAELIDELKRELLRDPVVIRRRTHGVNSRAH